MSDGPVTPGHDRDDGQILVPADPNAKVDGVSDLWDEQETKVQDLDFEMYNSKPWMVVKTVFCISIVTLTFILYALHELPWTIFGWGLGLLLFGAMPFFAGLMFGFSFENMKKALLAGIIISIFSLALAFTIFCIPYTLEFADYNGEFMLDVWFYTLLWVINMISFFPAGIVVGAATNMYE